MHATRAALQSTDIAWMKDAQETPYLRIKSSCPSSSRSFLSHPFSFNLRSTASSPGPRSVAYAAMKSLYALPMELLPLASVGLCTAAKKRDE